MYSWKVKTRAFREIKPHTMLEDLSMVLGVTCVDFKKSPKFPKWSIPLNYGKSCAWRGGGVP